MNGQNFQPQFQNVKFGIRKTLSIFWAGTESPFIAGSLSKIPRNFVLVLFILFFSSPVYAIDDTLAVRAIIGEAGNQGYHGMLALASALRNRGTLKGVYGVNAKHIDREPQWVFDQAKKAWIESKSNRIHSGDHWGSKICDKNWIAKMEQSGFVKVYDYKDHVFYRKETR